MLKAEVNVGNSILGDLVVAIGVTANSTPVCLNSAPVWVDTSELFRDLVLGICGLWDLSSVAPTPLTVI